MEFQKKAYWATARSRLEVLPVAQNKNLWEINVQSSVLDNWEQLAVRFDPTTDRVVKRSRLSKGKEQRIKLYQYETDFILRERRDPGADTNVPPQEWPVSYSGEITYPVSADDTVVTSTYLLVLLAQRLQAQELDKSIEVIVHTDTNFYRVRLTRGNGIPINVAYEITGNGSVHGKRETFAVALHIAPEGTPADKSDFSLFGLQSEIILFFDHTTGLPLQIRGVAPRIGATEINLKSVSMRESKP